MLEVAEIVDENRKTKEQTHARNKVRIFSFRVIIVSLET